jgi:hypothetical protein
MSYIERGVYWYLKNVFFGGIKTLLSKNYIFFTILALSMAALSFNPTMARIEVITAISFILGAWQPIIFPLAFVTLIIIPGIGSNTLFFIPLWAFFTASIALLVPRDMVDSWGGYALFFGNQKGHVPFNFIFNLIFFIGIAASLTLLNPYSIVFLVISLLMLYITNVFAKQRKNDRFGFALSIFYVNIFYYFLTINTPAFASGFIILDSFIALFTLFFAVQGNARILESKVAPHAAVFLTLGLALGFHSAGSANLHLYQFIFSAAIFPVVIVLFLSSDKVENYFTRQPSVGKAIVDFGKNKLEDFLKKLIQ